MDENLQCHLQNAYFVSADCECRSGDDAAELVCGPACEFRQPFASDGRNISLHRRRLSQRQFVLLQHHCVFVRVDLHGVHTGFRSRCILDV